MFARVWTVEVVPKAAPGSSNGIPAVLPPSSIFFELHRSFQAFSLYMYVSLSRNSVNIRLTCHLRLTTTHMVIPIWTDYLGRIIMHKYIYINICIQTYYSIQIYLIYMHGMWKMLRFGWHNFLIRLFFQHDNAEQLLIFQSVVFYFLLFFTLVFTIFIIYLFPVLFFFLGYTKTNTFWTLKFRYK